MAAVEIAKLFKIMENKFKLEVEYTKKDSSYGHSRKYRIADDKNNTMLRLSQSPFPDCCGVAILHNLSSNEMKTSDFIQCLDLIIEDLNKNDKFAKILHYNTIDSRVFKMMSRHPLALVCDAFRNRRSGNRICCIEIPIETKSMNIIDRIAPPFWNTDDFDPDDLDEDIYNSWNRNEMSFEDAVAQHLERHPDYFEPQGEPVEDEYEDFELDREVENALQQLRETASEQYRAEAVRVPRPVIVGDGIRSLIEREGRGEDPRGNLLPSGSTDWHNDDLI